MVIQKFWMKSFISVNQLQFYFLHKWKTFDSSLKWFFDAYILSRTFSSPIVTNPVLCRITSSRLSPNWFNSPVSREEFLFPWMTAPLRMIYFEPTNYCLIPLYMECTWFFHQPELFVPHLSSLLPANGNQILAHFRESHARTHVCFACAF